MSKWLDELLPIILDMLQDSSSIQKREVINLSIKQLTSQHLGSGYWHGSMELLFALRGFS